MQKLGIVAGAGELPKLVVAMAAAKSLSPVIVSLSQASDWTQTGFTPAVFGLTQIESILAHFTQNQVEHLVMVGKVERPQISADMVIDATSAKLLQEALPLGDDAALRAVLGTIAQAGLTVLPLQALMPEHKVPVDYDNHSQNGSGNEVQNEALTIAIKAHKRLSKLDVGQSLIAQGSRILAIEAAEGTDQMIARAKDLVLDDADALFFKASKTTQNKLLDPPVIGPDTIEMCYKSGITTIAIEAEHCLLAAPLAQIEALCARYDIRFMSVTIDEADKT